MLEEGAYATQLFSAVFFTVAGGRLLRLSRRTGEAPELLLGLYFALTGIAYFGWVLPYLVALGPLRAPSEAASWIVYSVGVVPFLIFTRVVFRKDARWATWCVVACICALAVGTTVLSLNGDLYPGLGDPFYWVQWLGYTVPCAWMASEAFLSYRVAARRSRIGLSDPIVVNRYLLLALFGAFQTFACLSDLLVTLDSADDRTISAWSDSILGGFEILGIGTLWLAFFPPASYLAWITRSARPAGGTA